MIEVKETRKHYKVMPKPRLKRLRAYCGGVLVSFPCSYRYNGGIVIGDKWYQGYSVPNPTVPKGHELVSIASGLNLNARPPQATMLLRKKSPQAKTSRSVGLDV